MPRALLLVLDGVGAGELPDAADYGDSGSDTLGNLARAVGGLDLPELQRLGLGNIHPIMGVKPIPEPGASFGSMAEASPGKDSTTGHWEMMGIILDRPFPLYPDGFPREIVSRLEERTGRRIIGNRPASGTEIIEVLGPRHQSTGEIIVYTSADSVLQIAAHEQVVPEEELYEICRIAREIMAPPRHAVARVIARPFTGRPGEYVRTPGRRDFSVDPPRGNLLDQLTDRGIPVTGVGKVDDLFNHRSITSAHVSSNTEGLDVLSEAMRTVEWGFVFANLVDFDMRWGHRNDIEGFARGLEEVDRALPGILGTIGEDELLLITADHGNDPTTPSTDHSREYVPLLCFSPGSQGVDLGIRETFADIAGTLAEYFGLQDRFPGRSFLREVL